MPRKQVLCHHEKCFPTVSYVFPMFYPMFLLWFPMFSYGSYGFLPPCLVLSRCQVDHPQEAKVLLPVLYGCVEVVIATAKETNRQMTCYDDMPMLTWKKHLFYIVTLYLWFMDIHVAICYRWILIYLYVRVHAVYVIIYCVQNMCNMLSAAWIQPLASKVSWPDFLKNGVFFLRQLWLWSYPWSENHPVAESESLKQANTGSNNQFQFG